MIDNSMAVHPMKNLIVKGSLSTINDSKLPKTDSILRIIAALVDEVCF